MAIIRLFFAWYNKHLLLNVAVAVEFKEIKEAFK